MESLVQITNHFKSSARVNELNFKPSDFLDHFIAHGSVLQLLDSLGAELVGTQQRTFTVTGPYGSGKSTLALFLDCLLGSGEESRLLALHKLPIGSGHRQRFEANFSYASGWAVVKHLCGLSSPIISITQSILSAADEAFQKVEEASEAQCLELIKLALGKLSAEHDGVLLLLDELGKALDYQSSIGGDLHFFQSFADLIQQYDNIIVIGFLHQSFAAYAKGRDTRTQNEWGKVQGRYKDFGFNPSIEESLYLIGESFAVENNLLQKLIDSSSTTRQVVAKYFKVNNPSALENVLPLDSLVALLLGPISKRSFSQNERSLFSFIATHEKYGFRDYLAQQADQDVPFKALYRVNNLWDYLYNNLGHIISASGDSKTWLEACDAVDRASTYGSDLHIFITKMVALLSMMGRSSNLYASKDFVAEFILSIPEFDFDDEDVQKALADLEARSIVIYRHNLNSYHIFRASDLDINRLVLEWIDRVKDGLDWVSAYQSDKLVLANSHYHRTGVMRWAETQLVSRADQVRIPSGVAGTAFVNFILPTTRELYAELKLQFVSNDYVAIADPINIDELEAASVELIALQKLSKEEADKLSRDPIAKTEIENREKLAKLQISKIIDKIFNHAKWSYRGNQLSGKSLTSKVSAVADLIYFDCPSVHNELVNRMKLSGTSNAALNKLMLAILNDDLEDDLNLPVATFPPEKGIYLSCLKSKGWHTPNAKKSFAGDWFDLDDPSKLPDEHQDTFKVWKAGFDFIKSSPEMVVIKDLHQFWMSPPFGLTMGLSKLYSMALLKSLESHLAFYDFDSTKDWIYIPELDEELVNKLWRYPAEAAVRYYELAETDLSLVKEIAQASSSQDPNSILATARSLVRQMHAIPSWVKRTSGKNLFNVGGSDHLDGVSKRFRDRVLSAKDPYKLILEDLPGIFSGVGNLTNALRESLESLLQIDIIVSAQFRSTMLDILSAEPGESFNERCDNVILNASRPDIADFAKRAKAWSETQTQSSLDELISLVVGVRKESWTDERISAGYDKLRNLCVQFKRYETFNSLSGKSSPDMTPVSLMFNTSDGVSEFEGFVDVKLELGKDAEKMSSEIKKDLSKLPSSHRIKLLMTLLSSEMINSNEAN